MEPETSKPKNRKPPPTAKNRASQTKGQGIQKPGETHPGLSRMTEILTRRVASQTRRSIRNERLHEELHALFLFWHHAEPLSNLKRNLREPRKTKKPLTLTLNPKTPNPFTYKTALKAHEPLAAPTSWQHPAAIVFPGKPHLRRFRIQAKGLRV